MKESNQYQPIELKELKSATNKHSETEKTQLTTAQLKKEIEESSRTIQSQTATVTQFKKAIDMLQEENEARQRENEGLSSKVSGLEKKLAELERMISLMPDNSNTDTPKPNPFSIFSKGSST